MIHFRSVILISFILAAFISDPVIAQDIQKPNTTSYNQGISLFEDGQYAKSADELEIFINGHPNHALVASAAFYRARARSKVNPAQAGAYYQQFIQAYPNTVFAQKLILDLANNKREEGEYDQALTYYEQALQQSINNKQSSRVYYWMAEIEAERGNNEQAREYYLKLADDYPKSEWAPKALFARGRLYLSENEYEASSEAFELLEERYPNDEMTRQIGTALGESYYQQQRFEEAIEALREGLPYLEGDQKAKAIFLIAESHNALNNFDEASSNYLQYINLTKGTDKERTAHYGLGWVYHKQEVYHWAADEFEKAAAGQDTLARKALYYKAVNEKLGGRYANSIRTFREFGNRYSGGLWFEEGYYEWAITAYEMGNYGEAIEALLVLVRSDEKLKWEGKVYTLLGQAYFANKEYTRALQAFNAAENLTDIDPAVKREARFQKAWVQYRNQAYEPAQKIFEQIHEEAPDTDVGQQALFWNADSYYNMQQYGPASREFRRFIQNYPDSKLIGAARYSLGWSYFKMGDYSSAIQPFRDFLNNYNPPDIALFPYDTDTRLRLGDSYYAMSDYDQAIQVYQQSVNDDPGGDYALFQIANSYYRSERTYEAVRTFRRFLQTFPNSRLREQAQYNIAYIYLNAENYEQAIVEFQTAINNYPGTRWAARSQYNIGDAYYNAGEYQKAIAAYRKVMEQYPNSDYVVEAANGIDYSRKAAQTGNPADKDTASTQSAVDEFIENNPQSATNDQLRYRQAESLVQSGDYLKAIEELEQYIRVSNNQELLPDAYINLATSYEQTSRSAKAAEAYKTVLKEYPDSDEAASALTELGRLEAAQGNHQAAYDYYNQLLDKGGTARLEAYVGMGSAQLAMGNTQAAKEQYQSALQINSSFDAAKVGLAKTAIKQGSYAEAEEQLSPVAEANT
ncbi:MAG: tetratricopeptide repeat protein, partial [Balneolaceae bacterium]|nr:tetratricopeptide repeat protein [Balneolaceae bacterium]